MILITPHLALLVVTIPSAGKIPASIFSSLINSPADKNQMRVCIYWKVIILWFLHRSHASFFYQIEDNKHEAGIFLFGSQDYTTDQYTEMKRFDIATCNIK